MTAYTEPTIAFTLEMASGTTPMWDALAGFTTQHPAADHARAVGCSRKTSDIKSGTHRRLRLPRWFSMRGRHVPTSAAQYPALASVAPGIKTVKQPSRYACRKWREHEQQGYGLLFQIVDAGII